MASIAHTFTSTTPSGRASSRTPFSSRSVGTPDARFGQATQIIPAVVVLGNNTGSRFASLARSGQNARITSYCAGTGPSRPSGTTAPGRPSTTNPVGALSSTTAYPGLIPSFAASGLPEYPVVVMPQIVAPAEARRRLVRAARRHTVRMALTDEAIVKIKEMITSGELGPGDRLPKEADLASRLGLSRNSLREAVKALTLVNVLDVRHGDGTFVTSLDSAHLLDALSFIVDLHRDDSVPQFFEVRRLLEPGAAALAAGRISKEQLEGLQTLTGSLTPSSGVDELVLGDLRFHRGIAEATGNAVVCSLLDGISGATQRARIWRGVTQAGAVERTLAEHTAILDAIELGDADAARAWMTAHIAGIETWLRKAP